MKSRNKDNKPHESIIGKIIYGFLLFMPLLAISVTWAYAIFNKNAYQSYNEKITHTYLIDNTNSSLVSTGRNYIYNGLKNPTDMIPTGWQISYKFTFINESVNLKNYFNTSYEIDGLAFATDNNANQYFRSYFRNKDTLEWNQIELVYFDKPAVEKYLNLKFEFTIDTFDTNFYLASNINYLIIENGSIDNVFYYSIDKVQQSPLFNWAKDSVIYTGMTNTCNALNITTPFIPLLMTYWLIISVIYILYDIILVILHIFHKKIHQLEDSF